MTSNLGDRKVTARSSPGGGDFFCWGGWGCLSEGRWFLSGKGKGWLDFVFFGMVIGWVIFFGGVAQLFWKTSFVGLEDRKVHSKTDLIWYVAGIYYWKLRKKIVICFTDSFVCCCLRQLKFKYQAAAGPRVLKPSFSLMRFFAGEDFIPNSQHIVTGVEVWIVYIINESPYGCFQK